MSLYMQTANSRSQLQQLPFEFSYQDEAVCVSGVDSCPRQHHMHMRMHPHLQNFQLYCAYGVADITSELQSCSKPSEQLAYHQQHSWESLQCLSEVQLWHGSFESGYLPSMIGRIFEELTQEIEPQPVQCRACHGKGFSIAHSAEQ